MRKGLAAEILDHRDRLARARPRLGLAGHIRCGVKIIAGDGAGAEALLDRSQSSQGDHLAPRVPRLEFEDISLGRAELAVRLSGHLKRATEIGEVVHIGRAEIDLKCVKNIGQRDVHALGLRAIHVHEHLRLVGAKA